MVKWEWLKVTEYSAGKWLEVEPAGRLGPQWRIQQYPKSKADVNKNHDADLLSFGSQAECSRASHSLIDHLCSEGWEPFAAVMLTGDSEGLCFPAPALETRVADTVLQSQEQHNL